jgi:hypothetical protein
VRQRRGPAANRPGLPPGTFIGDEMKTKGEARYTDKSPHEFKTCGNCHMFRKPQRCTLVRGTIRAPGWCKFWDGKKRT